MRNKIAAKFLKYFICEFVLWRVIFALMDLPTRTTRHTHCDFKAS